MKPALVFVYGTLMKGHGNNHRLGTSRLIGPAETEGRMRLFDAGFPVMRRPINENYESSAKVLGEVYLVTDENVIRSLDALESEGRMYHRKTIHVHLIGAMRKRVKAFAYIGDARFWMYRRVRLYDKQNGRYRWPGRRA